MKVLILLLFSISLVATESKLLGYFVLIEGSETCPKHLNLSMQQQSLNVNTEKSLQFYSAINLGPVASSCADAFAYKTVSNSILTEDSFTFFRSASRVVCFSDNSKVALKKLLSIYLDDVSQLVRYSTESLECSYARDSL